MSILTISSNTNIKISGSGTSSGSVSSPTNIFTTASNEYAEAYIYLNVSVTSTINTKIFVGAAVLHNKFDAADNYYLVKVIVTPSSTLTLSHVSGSGSVTYGVSYVKFINSP